MGQADDVDDRHDGAQGIGHVGHGDHFGLFRKHLLVFVEKEIAVVVDGHDLQLDPLLLAQDLPRHDVGMVLHVRQDNLVAGV